MRISVITVTLNAESTIKESILSVLNQSYKDIEYLIIDGVSTDKTVDIINNYKTRINYFVSELDNGIYDAMNKGISRSNGEILYFLGADDKFCDNHVLVDVIKEFELKNTDIIYGNVIRSDGKFNNLEKSIPYDLEIKSYEELLLGCCHQRVFVRKHLFAKYGLFNCYFKACADWEWFLRLYKKGIRMNYINRNIAIYFNAGYSTKQTWKHIADRYLIFLIYGGFNFFIKRISMAIKLKRSI